MAVSVSLTWYRLCLGLFLLIWPQESPYRCSCLSAAISTTEVYWRHSARYVTEARARGAGPKAQTRARGWLAGDGRRGVGKRPHARTHARTGSMEQDYFYFRFPGPCRLFAWVSICLFCLGAIFLFFFKLWGLNGTSLASAHRVAALHRGSKQPEKVTFLVYVCRYKENRHVWEKIRD